MAQSYFPLRWESTGDHQWWFASPIDYAAANGHYDLVRELLRLDINHLIKLTSLRRIRRLESLWDDDSRFVDAARCRASVARNLLKECEEKDGKNSLLKAGYGGWLLYTAASAGDMPFVQDLLERDPLLVFGEGEYGLTDILYAAARGKNIGVFRVNLDYALSPRGFGLAGGSRNEGGSEMSMFTLEVLNRAVHAVARGGNLDMLKELLKGCDDVSAYRDVNGSTVLHAASGRGQVEVVDFLINSFLLINSQDNNGNTALHIAAFRGHLLVVETLIAFSPPLISFLNKNGDTFLHMAVAGFRTPGFKRLDRQMELMRTLVKEDFNLDQIINVQNNQGRTVLHMAAVDNFQSDLVELLMSVRSIDLNLQDLDGFTPLDLLKRQPKSPSSEILIKELILAGGVSNLNDKVRRPYVPSNLRMHGFATSPGTLFKISDAEIILCTGIDAKAGNGERPSACSEASKGDVRCELYNGCLMDRRKNSLDKATSRIKSLLQWPRQLKEKKHNSPIRALDADSMDSLKRLNQCAETPTPLRQRFSKQTSLATNKRTLAVRNSTPSPVTKKRFASGMMQGVIQAMPLLTPISKPPNDVKQKGVCVDSDVASCSNSFETRGGLQENDSQVKTVSGKSRAINHYLCFGAQGLSAEDPVTGQRFNRMFKRSAISAA
ncbi:ankyrin repeat family protein [Carex rostrata]